MTPEKPPFGTIPTLTEVVPWPEAPPLAPAPAAASPAAPEFARPEAAPAVASPLPLDPAPAARAAASDSASATSTVTEAQLAQRVMAELQSQLDLVLEVRLREALAPVLARVGDALVRDARKELTTALRDVVARAVARELDRSDKP